MSTDYRIKPLDLTRRQPLHDYLLCRAGAGRKPCNGIIEFDCSFMCEGPGRRHVRHLFMCRQHAYRFARKHGLELPTPQSRAHRLLDALEADMKYRIVHADGRIEGGYTLRTVVNEAKRSFSLCYCRAYDGALFPMEDLEMDDVAACEVEIYRDWPDKDQKSIAIIQKEEDLEATHTNGIAGESRVTVEETDDADGLGACQGHGGGRDG